MQRVPRRYAPLLLGALVRFIQVRGELAVGWAAEFS